jgi:U5 small nuclear ribonucleoprotein component
MSAPQLIRNVVLIGHLHHGKTSFADMLIERTHKVPWNPDRPLRYTDARKDEQDRGVSIKATPVSLVLQNTAGKSYLLNVIDTPGHVNFSDEVTASLRAADGAVVVVDAVEGVMMNTERLIRHAVQQGLPVSLVINKVDRLILELKLPPTDAYFKLLHTMQEVNAIIAASLLPTDTPYEVSPVLGNVVFASSTHGWSFSLQSFSHKCCHAWGVGSVDYLEFAKRLWGDKYFERQTRRFKSSTDSGSVRTFIEFVLEPIYKIYSQVLGEDAKGLMSTLDELGLRLKKSELHMDPVPLLKLVFSQFLGDPSGFVDLCVSQIPSPLESQSNKVARFYTGFPDGPEVAAMNSCDASGPLVINVVKLIPTPDASCFLALARILSGTVVVGQSVKVLGENYTAQDEEDAAICTVTAVSIGQARYRVDVTRAPAGNLVLLEGVDEPIKKTATITGATADCADVAIFRALAFNTQAVVNIAVEALNPSELPKVVSGLRKIQKSYPLAHTRVEESGEHVILGTGELAMDSMLHDLR